MVVFFFFIISRATWTHPNNFHLIYAPVIKWIPAKLKLEKRKAKDERRLKRKREIEELGEDAPPKQIPKTLENTREFDETVVKPDDKEVES